MKCPKCQKEILDNSKTCSSCGFDIALYNETYHRIYNSKMANLEQSEKQGSASSANGVIYSSNSVHKPRCPYCNSDRLTKITTFDRAVNAAVFGLLGNKRKYQWHCNNCNTNF